jgi:hypothetical protein
MRDPVRPSPLFQTSGQRRSRCSLCDDGGFITQINHFITAGNSAEAVGRHDHREFVRKAGRSASTALLQWRCRARLLLRPESTARTVVKGALATARLKFTNDRQAAVEV